MQIIKRKKGYCVRFYDENKERVYLSGFETKDLAEAAVVEYKRQQLHCVDREITVEEYLCKWFDEYCNVKLDERTKKRYSEFIVLHTIPKIGDLKLSKLKPAHLKTFYFEFLNTKKTIKFKDKKTKEWKTREHKDYYSSTTVLQCHRILHEAFKHACGDGYIQSNPADYVIPPSKADTEIVVPSDEDIKALYEISKGTPYFMPIYIASVTGMRLGEVCGLQKDNIDLKNILFYVRWCYQRVNGEMKLDTVKTKGSRRNITFLDGTKEMIESYIKNQNKLKEHYRVIWLDNNYFFTEKDGTPLLPEALSKKFVKYVKKLGLNEDITFHCLRHYHASWLLKNNVHPKIVQERLGHSRIQITLDTYSHLIPNLQEQVLVGLDTSIYKVGNCF